MKITLGFVAMALAAGVCQAQSAAPAAAPAPSATHFFAGMEFGGGGDPLARVQYTDGSSETVKAGGGGQFKGGLEYRFNPSAAMRASVGYEFQSAGASNGDVTFSRWPIELMGLWNVSPSFRLGAGLRYPTNATLSSSGAASDVGHFSLKGQPGAVLEGEYFASPQYSIGLRLVGDKYKVDNVSVNGNHISLSLNYYFGQ